SHGAVAGGKSEVARLRKLGSVSTRRSDRKKCPDREQTSRRSRAARGRQRQTRGSRHAENCRSRKRRVPDRGLGLGFLFGESAQSEIRFRRIAAASLLRTEPRNSGRGFLRR